MGWIRKGPEPKPPKHYCKKPWPRIHPVGSLWECDDCGDQWEIYKRPGLNRRWGLSSTRVDRMHGVDRPEPSEGESRSADDEDYEDAADIWAASGY